MSIDLANKHQKKRAARTRQGEGTMKIAASILAIATTAGLALLALTTRKGTEVVEAIQNVDRPQANEESTSVAAIADTWFV